MQILRFPPFRLTLLAWLAVLVAAGWFVRPLPAAATRASIGFSTLYTAGRLMLEGSSLSQAYDDAWFGVQVRRFAPSVPEIYRPNPPAAALLGITVAWMDYRGARIAWTLASLAALAAITLWMVRHLDAAGLAVPGCVLFVLLFQPIRACLWFGQAYILLLFLLILGFEGLRSERPPQAGVSLGAILGFKLTVPLIALVLLKRRHWKTMAWMSATVIAVCLVSLVWPGTECWRAWLSYLSRPAAVAGWRAEAVTAYQTIPGFFAHLTRFDARWNPSPSFDAPRLGRVLSVTATVLLVAASTVRTARSTDPALPIAMLTLTSLVVSPWTLDYHYPLTLLPIVIVMGVLWDRAAGFPLWSVLALGALLLSVPQRWYGAPALQSGARALLAYPKLYGALVIWGLAFALSSESSLTTVSSVPAPDQKRASRPSRSAGWRHVQRLALGWP